MGRTRRPSTPGEVLSALHMLADTQAELHAMADRIGVARRWFQSPPKASRPHYDIALSKRALAVATGAREITTSELRPMLRAWREQAAMLGEWP
jgi:Protein of unknown function (DUF4031)